MTTKILQTNYITQNTKPINTTGLAIALLRLLVRTSTQMTQS